MLLAQALISSVVFTMCWHCEAGIRCEVDRVLVVQLKAQFKIDKMGKNALRGYWPEMRLKLVR